MFDVVLYGHLTHDRIINGFDQYTTIGSIGNVWKTINKINPKLKIKIEPTAIGEALIYINESICERTSVANLNLIVNNPNIYNSLVSHILYINELPDLSFISKIKSKYVTADFCAGQKLKNLNILKYIDFLFISDEDMFYDIDTLLKFVRKGVIVHCNSGSLYYNNSDIMTTNVTVIDNINVLGAGDKFAGCFIKRLLESDDPKASIQYAHKKVGKILTDEN